MHPRILALIFATVTLTACSGGGSPVVVDYGAGDGGGEVVEGVAGGVSAVGLGDDGDGIGTGESGTVSDTSGDPLSMRILYFEYDSSVITAAAARVVQAHAQYLRGASEVEIILEGHTDERGTREYNLALAEDRAQSVANMLQALGVALSRIQTVSYGEERPDASGHAETDWRKNRRVNILY